ncbi:GtrA family protein [Streptomyces sp. DSM 41527]|uniref:GtrA family protein n=1 Tax=Streptomyces mooreae TaxID=3075523 RepID=A0ABU2TBQ8_9ACTN|nr:GtrA family protein [Streptomyces sp. DSM 41527]MDT0458320.1 GtrA family protein [Streptomyces sp. DSM 41527]
MRASPASGRPGGRIVRFAAVGGVNTLTFSACYLALHHLLPYFAAYTAAFVTSMTGSFFLHTYVTYRTRPTWTKFLLFPLTQVTNYGVQSAGLVALVGWCRLSTTVAPLVAALCALPFSYLLSRRILRPPTRAGRSTRTGSATPAGPPAQADPAPQPGPPTRTGPPPARSGKPA